MITPWGASQHQHKITEGVYEVDTAGHGGILVSGTVASQLLSPAALKRGWEWGKWYAYEEDCDWAIFGYEQPELYAAARNKQTSRKKTPEEMKQIAHGVLERWHPTYLTERADTFVGRIAQIKLNIEEYIEKDTTLELLSESITLLDTLLYDLAHEKEGK